LTLSLENDVVELRNSSEGYEVIFALTNYELVVRNRVTLGHGSDYKRFIARIITKEMLKLQRKMIFLQLNQIF
jgi:hypothetical protein